MALIWLTWRASPCMITETVVLASTGVGIAQAIFQSWRSKAMNGAVHVYRCESGEEVLTGAYVASRILRPLEIAVPVHDDELVIEVPW